MRVGLHIGKFQWPGSPDNIGATLARVATTADQAGFYSLWVMDHLFQLGERYGIVHGPITEPMLEGYSTIAYFAALTQRIKVGLLVTCNFFRPPGLLVKIVSTIDVLSGGRAYLGIGAGWFEREATGLGIPLPPTWTERFERLEETLRIAQQMWAGDFSPVKGRHYQLAEPINSPQPVSKPHPPILIGGGGERKTLRLVAQYADACNFVAGSPYKGFPDPLQTPNIQQTFERLRHKLAVLQRHCEAVGRPYADIEKTVVTYIMLAPGAQTAAEVVDLCQGLAELGFEHVMFVMPNTHEIEPLEVMGREVIPQVTDM